MKKKLLLTISNELYEALFAQALHATNAEKRMTSIQQIILRMIAKENSDESK